MRGFKKRLAAREKRVIRVLARVDSNEIVLRAAKAWQIPPFSRTHVLLCPGPMPRACAESYEPKTGKDISKARYEERWRQGNQTMAPNSPISPSPVPAL